AWYPQLLKPAIEGLKLMGFNWERLLREVTPPLEAVGELRRLERAVRQLLQPVVRARLARQLVAENEVLLARLKPALSKYPHDHDGVVGDLLVAGGLVAAVRKGDGALSRRAFGGLAELNAKKQTLAERLALLSRLEAAAPGWATAIRSRDGRHGGTALPGDPAEAWLWRQLSDEPPRRPKGGPAPVPARVGGRAAHARSAPPPPVPGR